MFPLERTAALAATAVVTAALAACSSAAPAVEPATAPTASQAAAPAPEPTETPMTGEDARAQWDAAADAARPGPPPELLETTPVAVDEFLARFAPANAPLADAAAVNAEYQEAARAFPLALPDGWAFPADSRIVDRRVGDWHVGDGAALAFEFWQNATATAAFADQYGSADGGDSTAHLDALSAGYNSPLRAAYVDDPGYLDRVVAPAYEGNLDNLYRENVDRFQGRPDHAAIAELAGDWSYLGTEGYAYAVPDDAPRDDAP